MQPVSKVFFYLIHKLWVAVALCLVVLAVGISLLRLTLPHADNAKHHIEQLLSQQLGSQVTIGQLNANWQRTGPALVLENITLSAGSPFTLSIAETAIQLNFWQTLLQRSLQAEHFVLTGLELQLDTESLWQQNGHASDTAPLTQALEQLFFRQLRSFSVLNSQLVLLEDAVVEQRLQISHLHWQNAGERHQSYGEIRLQDVSANSVSFILDFNGARWQDAEGQLYLKSRELNVLPWLRAVVPQSSQLKKANINFEAWARLSAGKFKDAQLDLAENELHWEQDKEPYQLNLGPGQLYWKSHPAGWQLTSSDLRLSNQHQDWPGFRIGLDSSKQQYLASLEHFPLDAILPFAALFAEQEPRLLPLVSYQPSGQLALLQGRSSSQGWQWFGRIEQLTSRPLGDVPGLDGIDLHFTAQAQQAVVHISGQSGELSWDGLFTDTWPYQQLDARLRIDMQNEIPVISLQHSLLEQADFKLEASAELILGAEPELALLAQLTGLDAAKAYLYYPNRYMPEKTRAYLTSAIETGRLEQATVIWQGAFADYPFTQGEGHFQVFASLSEGVFRFAPNWPPLTELSAELWFENAAMQIIGREGLLDLIPLTEPVFAEIADLREAQQLTIQLDTALDASALTALMLNSALKDSLGKTLNHLGLAGPVTGNVLLEIGLTAPTVIASGTANLNQIQAKLAAPAVQLDQVSGLVHFRNEVINGEALQFYTSGLPMSGSFTGQQQNNGYQLELLLQGQAKDSELLPLLWTDADNLLQGNVDWQLSLALNLPEQGFSYQATLGADLTQLALTLPEPFNKPVGQVTEVLVIATGDELQSSIGLSSLGIVDFKTLLNHETGLLTQAQLALGTEAAVLSQPDFSIEINLDAADAQQWFDFLQPLLASNTQNTPLLPPLRRVRGKVNHLALVGPLALQHTVFDLKNHSDAWHLQLNGAELASRWQFHHSWRDKGISAQIDYLHLKLPEPVALSEEQPVVTPAEPLSLVAQDWLVEMVPLQISCNECSIGSYRLGQVEFKSAGTGNAWQLTEFSSQYKGSLLELTGSWQPDDNIGFSEFSGRFTSANLGSLLQEFGLSSAISGSRSDISLEFNWLGAPQQFRLGALNGQVKFQLGEGTLTEVSDQGARLFSLFSLNSLLRKLRLDFRDVFAKGFFYNRMSGTLSLQQGVAQTSDFIIDGVPGNMQLQGYADLLKRELDYQVAFSPKVTSSLPVIIAWMVNPATGLAALALDEVFQSAEVISRINFTVTGSFDKPQVTEVNRHSTEVPVPVRIAQPERRDDDVQQPRIY